MRIFSSAEYCRRVALQGHGMIATERLYPIRRPLAAALAGAAVALLGGLIGLGGAEFRLPTLITVFALYAHRAIRINLLSLATLAISAAARLGFVQSAHVADFSVEIAGMRVGGIVAAWLGASALRRIPKTRMMGIIAALLLVTAALLAAETPFQGSNWGGAGQWLDAAPFRCCRRWSVGRRHQQLLGVAGGEFIIPS
jgi:uncharacterized protein